MLQDTAPGADSITRDDCFWVREPSGEGDTLVWHNGMTGGAGGGVDWSRVSARPASSGHPMPLSSRMTTSTDLWTLAPSSVAYPELVEEVLVVMKALAQDGMTMIVVTHEIGFAREVGDTLSMFSDGVIIEHVHAREVLDDPQHECTGNFLASVR